MNNCWFFSVIFSELLHLFVIAFYFYIFILCNQRNQTFTLPQRYILWEVQWREEHLSIEELISLQWELLWSILSSWDIQTFPVEETQRLQNIKMDRNTLYRRDLRSIPLRDIATEDQREQVIWNLEMVWAGSTLFERYTTLEHDPMEVALNDTLFRRLGLTAYKRQLLWILSWNLTASIPIETFMDITKRKLKSLWCTDTYLESFIQKHNS